MKKSKLIIIGAALFGMSLLSVIEHAVAAPGGIPSYKSEKLKISILHIGDETGERYKAGVMEAIQEHPYGSKVEPDPQPYVNTKYGYETMKSLMTEETTDIIIGPTDSDVYIQGIENRLELEKHGIPVISALVIANVPYKEGGWFFRTNVDVSRRVETIKDYLNKYWVRSTAVLYANTEWARRAEKAFGENYNKKGELYMPLMYDVPPSSARMQIRRILNIRPDAVGIFGEREDLKDIYKSLKRMNADLSPYHPILFTIIDARYTHSVFDDTYIVSVATPDQEVVMIEGSDDDVKALAYDTTILVLNILQNISEEKTNIINGKGFKDTTDAEKKKIIRSEFRDRFEAIYRSHKAEEGLRTNIGFSRYKNSTKMNVFHQKDGTLKKIDLEEAVCLKDKFKHKIGLILSRFGNWPIINSVMLVLIVSTISILDLKKWYAGSIFGILFKLPVILLLTVTNILVFAFFIYMAETGKIRYDSILATLVIAFTPLAVLRTSLFETAQGKVLGLARSYERFLQWVNDRLMITKYIKTKKYVALVAYHNSVEGMKSYLRNMYRGYEVTSAQRIRLEGEMEQLVNDRISYVGRRKVCARLLLRKFKIEELQRDNMAPQGEIENLFDPEIVIKTAARYCAQEDDRSRKVDDAINSLMDKNKGRKVEREAALANDLKGIVGEQEILRRKIAFLFVLRGYDPKYLIDEGLIDQDYEMNLREQEIRNKSLFQTIKEYIGDSIKDFFCNYKGRILQLKK